MENDYLILDYLMIMCRVFIYSLYALFVEDK